MKVCFRFWVVALCVLAQAQAGGPIYLQELLRRLAQEASTKEEQAAAREGVAHLVSGDAQKASAALRRLSQRIPPSELSKQLFSATIDFDAAIAKQQMFKQSFRILDAESQEALAHFATTQLGVFRTLEDVWPEMSRLRFVRSRVKEFNQGVARGFKNAHLGFLMAPEKFQPFINSWRERAPEDCVAVIGSGLDDPRVRAFKEENESAGKVVFFYTDCRVAARVLCPDETVGAFMKTAGTVVLFDSGNARKSAYTMVEATQVGRLRAGQSEAILLSPADLQVDGAGQLFAVSGTVILLQTDQSN
jgi:hypothetical protein